MGWLQVNSRATPHYTPAGDYRRVMIGTLLQLGELPPNLSAGSQVGLRAQMMRHDVSERTHRNSFRRRARMPQSRWRIA